MFHRIIPLLVVFSSLVGWSQNPPDFASNNLDSLKEQSILLRNLKDLETYDFLLAFHQEGYWNTGIQYTVLAWKGEQWQAFEWVVYFDSKQRAHENIRKIKKKKIKLQSGAVEEILADFDSCHFWDLHFDSINRYEPPVDTNERDSLAALGIEIEQFRYISDGNTWIFEIWQPNAYKFLSSYEPLYFMDIPPVRSREILVYCKNLFYDTLHDQ